MPSTQMTVTVDELQPGDIVLLQAGDLYELCVFDVTQLSADEFHVHGHLRYGESPWVPADANMPVGTTVQAVRYW